MEGENWFALWEYGKSLVPGWKLERDFTVDVGRVGGEADLAVEIERLVDLEGSN